jgi:hypothetical protein
MDRGMKLDGTTITMVDADVVVVVVAAVVVVEKQPTQRFLISKCKVILSLLLFVVTWISLARARPGVLHFFFPDSKFKIHKCRIQNSKRQKTTRVFFRYAP